MTDVVSVGRYGALLREHLRSGIDEQSLLDAYELGRHLMEEGAGLLDVVRLHGTALAALDRAALHSEPMSSRAAGFLAEVLAPFEMAYLGFQEANDSLRHLTATLEEQVEDRTRALQESLSTLQTAEAERRRLLGRVVAAEEQERRRIADDVHDDTIQAVVAAALRLSSLRRRLEPMHHPSLERVERSVDEAIARLRRLVFQLRPPALDRQGLRAALQDLTGMMMEDDGPEYRLQGSLEHEPPMRVAEIAYRICQEALANVRKHAQASRVDVHVKSKPDELVITVIDNGRGFDTRRLQVPRPGHLGTAAMQERAALGGGDCRIDSAPDKGTTVTVRLPFGPAA